MSLDLSDLGKDLIRELAAKSEEGIFFLCHEEGGGTDPNTGKPIAGVVVKTPVDGAKTEYRSDQVDGTNILVGDWLLVMPFDAPVPVTGKWWCEFTGNRYSPVADRSVNPAGKLQVYKFQMRSS